MPTTIGEVDGVGLDARGRLRKCPANFNCVSTSSTSPEQYGAAWTSPEPTLDAAVGAIESAVKKVCPEATFDGQSEREDGARYVRFLVNGKLGADAVEFLVKNEGVGDRNW